jgi:glycolate oxidase iron-sulfur subunit
MAASTDSFEILQTHHNHDEPQRADLDRCVHCGLCLNACPTYRELGVEMDSPRGRIYQMVQVADGAPITDSYREHMDLCLACRACETACPSGVEYGKLIEAARAQLEANTKRSWADRTMRTFLFERLLQSPGMLTAAGSLLYLYQASGLQKLLRISGVMKLMGKLGRLEELTPAAQIPFFFSKIGKTFPAEGKQRYRVALMAGCIANVSFARLNEATVRVLQKNGCEVVIPAGQTCCGALPVHAGMRDTGRRAARKNIDVVLAGNFDAVISNAAGCGSTLKEYGELLEGDADYADKAKQFSKLTQDVNQFLASLTLNPMMGKVEATATYQDSCHLLHGQKIKAAPRKLLAQVPGLEFREMPKADICCGSAGVYNIVQNDMAMEVLRDKMGNVNSTKAEWIVTANPGCMLQLEAGVRIHGNGQKVMHVVEVLDRAYASHNKPVLQ